jgi:hypothetical protein
MNKLPSTLAALELAQIGWVVPDMQAAVNFLPNALGKKGFPEPAHIRALDLRMSYYGQLVAGEWLTTQTYNGGSFIELIQPLSGQSMFHDYLAQHPAGGTQHLAFLLPIEGYEQVTHDLVQQGYEFISEVDHPIARMGFFNTYEVLGVATEIMGVKPEGWAAIEQMRRVE